ncbi:alpha/beta hydrolase [Microbacterium panaciterrae]|uniref:Alpha/beta hydrolase n=1 Tax=Microbacterium panaciterrae TaxID=985759 RepID=A0ABP8P8A6_9MICO
MTPSRLLGMAVVGTVLVLTGCTDIPAAPPASSPSTSSTSSTGRAYGRLVDIGGGRSMFLTCRGSGTPTIVLFSGTGGAADEWTTLPAAGPSSSAVPVFTALSASTRVCAYDRPGTARESGATSPTTAVAQPTTASQGVRDLDALLAAAHENGPYLLVGASWGGLLAQLFAREHRGSTAGLVLVDSASAYLEKTLTPEQWRAWMTTIATAPSAPQAERPAYEPTLTELADAGPAPSVPAAVLSSDQPWDLGVTPGASTWPGWLAAQDRLAAELHAAHIGDTHSGHGIQVEQPALVTDAIRAVLADARRR